MARISPELVAQIARLAKIKLSEGDVEKYSAQLGDILDYMDKLNELDIAGVEPFTHAVELDSVFREDDPALSNAPRTDGTYFIVPPVIGQ